MSETNESVTVSLRLSAPAQSVWQAAFGTGFDEMPWWRKAHGDWENVGEYVLGIEDPDDETKTITKTVTLPDIVAAIQSMLDNNVPVWGQVVPFGCEMANDWDADIADAVLQTVMLGSVVYG